MLDEQGRNDLMDELKERLTPIFNDVEAPDAISCMLVGAIGLAIKAYGGNRNSAILILSTILRNWIDEDVDHIEPEGHA